MSILVRLKRSTLGSDLCLVDLPLEGPRILIMALAPARSFDPCAFNYPGILLVTDAIKDRLWN